MSTSEHMLECVRPPKDNRVLGYRGVTQKLREAITDQKQPKYGPCPKRGGEGLYKCFGALILSSFIFGQIVQGGSGTRPKKMLTD